MTDTGSASDQSEESTLADPHEHFTSLMDCLLLISDLEGQKTSLATISAGLPLEDGKLTSELFVRAANRAGLAAMVLQRSLQAIPPGVLPAIISLDNDRYAVMTDIDVDAGYVMLMAPVGHGLRQIDISELLSNIAPRMYQQQ